MQRTNSRRKQKIIIATEIIIITATDI